MNIGDYKRFVNAVADDREDLTDAQRANPRLCHDIANAMPERFKRTKLLATAKRVMPKGQWERVKTLDLDRMFGRFVEAA